MANKTKNDLLLEIEELKETLANKEDELVRYREVQAFENMGQEYKIIYDNFVKAGFTEEQAFRLMEISVERTIHDFLRPARGTYRNYSRY